MGRDKQIRVEMLMDFVYGLEFNLNAHAYQRLLPEHWCTKKGKETKTETEMEIEIETDRE